MNANGEIDAVKDDGDNNDVDVDGIDIEDKEKPRKEYANMAMVVLDFINEVIPSRNLFKDRKGNFMSTIGRHHGHFRVFSGSAMNFSRTVRFLGVVIIVMSEIFVDTLFFGVFFPSDGSCNVLLTEVSHLIDYIDSF